MQLEMVQFEFPSMRLHISVESYKNILSNDDIIIKKSFDNKVDKFRLMKSEISMSFTEKSLSIAVV